MRWIEGNGRTGVARIVFEIGRNKVRTEWGKRERKVFSNKKEACKKKVPRQSRSTFIMKYC